MVAPVAVSAAAAIAYGWFTRQARPAPPPAAGALAAIGWGLLAVRGDVRGPLLDSGAVKGSNTRLGGGARSATATAGGSGGERSAPLAPSLTFPPA